MENKNQTIISALGIQLPKAEDPEIEKALTDHFSKAIMETFVAGLGDGNIARLNGVFSTGTEEQIEQTIKEIATLSPQLGARIEARIKAETELISKLK